MGLRSLSALTLIVWGVSGALLSAIVRSLTPDTDKEV